MQTDRVRTWSSATGGSACYDNRRFLRIESGRSRVCLHVVTGRVDAPKICTRQFECYHCGFDQLLDDMEITGNMGPCAEVSRLALDRISERIPRSLARG